MILDATNENARPGEEPGRAQGQLSTELEATSPEHSGINDAATPRVRTPSFEPYLEAGLQLIPLHRWNAKDARGRDRGKTPRDGAWQVREYDSAAVAAAAERENANVGVRLPSSLVVLDVDPRNFGDGDSLLALQIDTGLDLRGVPHAATGSGGSHYWFSKPIDVALLDSLEAYPGVEFKSVGRQVVAAGSIHPNGRHYEWTDGIPDLRDLPELPKAVLDLARRPVRSHGEGAGFGELTVEQVAETLEQLDPTDFRDHEEWLNLMMACHHATAGEARQEFVDWSTQDPAYVDHAWVIGRRWDSLHADSGRGGRPITARYLHKVVQEHGGEVPLPKPEDDFEPWEEDVPEGAGVDDALLRTLPPEREGVEGVIDELNERHYVVLDNGFQVVTEEPDPLFEGRVRYQRLSKSDFRSAYENRLIEANNKLVSHADVWLKSARRRQYKGMIFDPAREHDGWLNMWKGWSVQPKPGDWSLLRELIRDVLVDGNRQHFEWVLDWMAFMFQNPEKVAEVAVAFRGKKGTGKGTLGRTLVKLAGAQGLHIASPSHLTGRFNSHLQNCVCLFADEAFWAGDKAGESVLKQLVTEPTLTYEGKGRDAVTGRNHVHIVMASNNDWVVPAGLDGERRFAVFDVSDKRMGDHAFFNALNRQLENGGLAALLHDMLARGLRGGHPRDKVPQTKALAAQKEMSMSPEEAWWDDLLTAGELPRPFAEPNEWMKGSLTVDLQALHALYVEFVGRHKMGRARTSKALAMAIKRKAGIDRRQVNGKWFWVLPQLDEARAIWAKVMGNTDSD